MKYYRITTTPATVGDIDGSLIKIGFGEPAQNPTIVEELQLFLEEGVLAAACGKPAFLNGPASLPVACTLVHALAHTVPFIGVYDPKLAAYVVAVSHDPAHHVGELIAE